MLCYISAAADGITYTHTTQRYTTTLGWLSLRSSLFLLSLTDRLVCLSVSDDGGTVVLALLQNEVDDRTNEPIQQSSAPGEDKTVAGRVDRRIVGDTCYVVRYVKAMRDSLYVLLVNRV